MLEYLFNKVEGLQACYFIKKRLQHSCFHVKFTKSLRTPFFRRATPVAFSGMGSYWIFIGYFPSIAMLTNLVVKVSS